MKRILVTGCDGMLGSAVEQVFSDYKLIKTDIEELDVRGISMHSDKIDYILHLAALTDLEYCENYPRHAYFTNTIGTMNMVELAKELDIPIVYISTAGVFGKEEGKLYNNKQFRYYDENSKPSPINMYGLSKYYGELAVQAYPKHYIFRISWAFGGGSRDRKFVMKVIKQIRQGFKEIYAINDVSGSPSYTKDVAKVIKDFIDTKKPYGLYHIPSGVATRYDVAKEIVRLLGAPTKICAVKDSYFLDYTATRPKCEVLLSVKDVRVRHWRKSIEEYINELVADKSIS
ncbi:hypothetical protein LCGC14_1459000 [marine sediment metagenome]|uniref:RmlD-like substrate binding domain-containing protein n=1 Tax=marine sediment metagenome TaxID=412755 RepID=A0A0F9K1R1_9ZZZZ